MIAENGALGQPQGNEQGREVMQEQVVKQKVQLTPGTSVERMDRMVVADGPLADEKIDRRTANLLWTVVVCAFAVVLVGSFIALAASVFVPGAMETRAQMIMTLFTTVVGFLGGLFMPSPVEK
jgi:hypothetical protein